jgi:hypothetical protein
MFSLYRHSQTNIRVLFCKPLCNMTCMYMVIQPTTHKTYTHSFINLLAPEFGIYILAHCKMPIIQEPKKVAL